jgi:glutamyl-tRNA(Gln) amidotransferase subunit E
MYPETDVKPTQVTAGKIEVLAANLPDMPEVKLAKYQEKYELNEKLAVQILDSEHLDLFEELAGKGLSTTLLAVTLTEDLTKLRRDGVPTDDLSQDAIKGTFMLVKDGTTVKESISDMLAYLAKNPIHDAKRAITELGLEMMSDEEIKHLVESAVKEREDLVKDRGMKAMGPLMGVIMGKARGKASPQQVNKLLNAAIRAIIE